MASEPVFLSIVIPAFNEESRLPATLREIAGYLVATEWNWEVRVVDDGSSDRTAEVTTAFSRGEPRVFVQSEPHRGKGGAVKAGLMAARGSYRIVCDADLSVPISEIVRFLPPRLTGVDVAIGTREGEGACRIGEPIQRHIVGRIFNALVKLLLLPGINDTQCGFKMFTARAAELIFPLVTSNGWAFDIEALCIARHHALRFVEVPIEWHYRDHSQVKVVRDAAAMFAELLRIRRRAAAGAYRPGGLARDPKPAVSNDVLHVPLESKTYSRSL
jgi:glycosyltransferase involved in cell wall biosynthesis